MTDWLYGVFLRRTVAAQGGEFSSVEHRGPKGRSASCDSGSIWKSRNAGRMTFLAAARREFKSRNRSARSHPMWQLAYTKRCRRLQRELHSSRTLPMNPVPFVLYREQLLKLASATESRQRRPMSPSSRRLRRERRDRSRQSRSPSPELSSVSDRYRPCPAGRSIACSAVLGSLPCGGPGDGFSTGIAMTFSAMPPAGG